ncbi:hypothetical protein IAQ61_001371 [Plenodomus lingam]|uniref:uncharacterized protein n=1 Tax=Leptosphaeria maculans TaxID=5022 RepID=UPI00331C3FAB|nr:hypothetical protein IAQ61_001371 [Plenodomus lingam]
MVPPPRRRWDENHVFVKNVPQYLAKVTIPQLFEEYNLTSTKNNYPAGQITTMVFGFRNRDDARRAQEAHHNRLIDGVQLHVELYQDRKSVRYLRETADQKRLLGTTDKEFPSRERSLKPAKEVSLAEFAGGRERKKVQDLVTHQPSDPEFHYPTWARIVANAHTEPLSTAPDFSPGGGRDTPITIDDTPIRTPQATPSRTNMKLMNDVTVETETEINMDLANTLKTEPEIQMTPKVETASVLMRSLLEPRSDAEPRNTPV